MFNLFKNKAKLAFQITDKLFAEQHRLCAEQKRLRSEQDKLRSAQEKLRAERDTDRSSINRLYRELGEHIRQDNMYHYEEDKKALIKDIDELRAELSKISNQK